MKKVLFLLFVIALFIGCSSSNDFEKGKQQLESQGYTDIVNTGWSAFCCGEGDNYSTGFKCKDKLGQKVEGCMCSSILKGITIRFK